MADKILELVFKKDQDEEFEKTNEDVDVEDNQDIDENAHSKLISNIKSLESTKQFKWKATRDEAKTDVNEFNLSKKVKTNVKLIDLLKSSKDESGNLKKVLRKLEKKKTLNKPLEKTVSDLIKRKTYYQQATKEVSKWDETVKANRAADQLVFPLKQPTLKLQPANDVVKHFVPKTEMEIEIDQMLKKSENVFKENKMLTEAEEKYLKAMSFEEAKLRHKELQKMRALLSYQEAKMKRLRKIKSKRYHRILKREKIKKELKDFEIAKETNSDYALEKLKELDKLRILERASLKHKNTGKWAKHKKLRAKYDDNARRALIDQIELSKKLTKKVIHEDSESESDEKTKMKFDSLENDDQSNEDHSTNVDLGEYNPWMKSAKVDISKSADTTLDDLSEDERKNKLKSVVFKINNKIKQSNDETDSERDFDINLNHSLITEEYSKNQFLVNDGIKTTEEEESHNKSISSKAVKIDPQDFITIDQEINYTIPDLKQINEVEDSDEEEQRKLISEAFADDDVVNEFQIEKQEIIDKEKEKDVSLYLPGWGTWGGKGVKKEKRKAKKFVIKAKKKPRKDSNIGNVIISEKNYEIISKFKVFIYYVLNTNS